MFRRKRRPRPANDPGRRGAARRGWLIDLAAIAALAAAAVAIAGDRRRADPALPSIDGGRTSRHAPSALALRERGRGRRADSPAQLERLGWRDVVGRAWAEFNDDNIPLVAAGVTFYALLALFPAMGVVVSLYGLFADLHDVGEQLQALAVILPREALSFLADQMVRLAAGDAGGLSLALASSLAISLWSANGAAKSIILGLNIAYEEQEKRSFVRLTLVSLAFTLGGLGLGAVLLAGTVAVPLVARLFGPEVEQAAGPIRWPLLAAGLWFGVTVLYRYGPSRDRPRWRWVTWGAAAVTAAWIGCSAVFSIYLSQFAHYDRTYGPLGAAIGFLMWTYLSAILVLAGAELNAEMEHQTGQDTTTGPPMPLGRRGARMADTLGKAVAR
jgi:membrane protein